MISEAGGKRIFCFVNSNINATGLMQDLEYLFQILKFYEELTKLVPEGVVGATL